LAEQGLMMREGTIVDATLIAAPPATKNKDGERGPQMHQSKKGNDWRFGMKAHVRVDAASGLVHTHIGTADKSRGQRSKCTKCKMQSENNYSINRIAEPLRRNPEQMPASLKHRNSSLHTAQTCQRAQIRRLTRQPTSQQDQSRNGKQT